MANASLVVLAETGDLAELRRRIDAGTDANAADPDGRVALHAAFAEGQLEIVRFLLGRGADPLRRDAMGNGALHWAAWSNDRAVIELARDVGREPVDVIDVEGRTPLSWAAGAGDGVAVAWFLEHGADPNRVDLNGWAPLHFAGASGHVDVIRQLLTAGATPLLRLPPNQGEDYGHLASDLARHFAAHQPDALQMLEAAEDGRN